MELADLRGNGGEEKQAVNSKCLEVFLLKSWRSLRAGKTPLKESLVKFTKFRNLACKGLPFPFNLCAVLSTPAWTKVSTDPTALKHILLKLEVRPPRLPDFTNLVIKGSKSEGKFKYTFSIERKEKVLFEKSSECVKPWDFGGLRDAAASLFPLNTKDNILGLENIDRIETDFEFRMNSFQMSVTDEKGTITAVLAQHEDTKEPHQCCLWMRTPELSAAQLILPHATVRDSYEAREPLAPVAVPEEVDYRLWFKYYAPNSLFRSLFLCLTNCMSLLINFVKVELPYLAPEFERTDLEDRVETSHVRAAIKAIAVIWKAFPEEQVNWSINKVSTTLKRNGQDSFDLDEADDIERQLLTQWENLKQYGDIFVGPEVSNTFLLAQLQAVIGSATEPFCAGFADEWSKAKQEKIAEQSYQVFDALDFGSILKQNCSDFLDPANSEKGLFWRQSHPRPFKKFFLRAVEYFISLGIPLNYLCPLNAASCDPVPSQPGELYRKSTLKGDLKLKSCTVTLGDNARQWCHTNLSFSKASKTGWRVETDSKLAVMYRQSERRKSRLFIINFGLVGTLDFKDTIKGEGFRQLKLSSENGRPVIWKLSNNLCGIIEKFWYKQEEQTPNQTGKAHASLKMKRFSFASILRDQIDALRESEDINQLARAFDIEVLLKYAQQKEEEEDGEQSEDGSSQEPSEDRVFLDPRVPKDASRGDKEIKGIQIHPDVNLEGIEVSQGKVFVMGFRATLEDDQEAEDSPETSSEFKCGVFIHSFKISNPEETSESPFFISKFDGDVSQFNSKVADWVLVPLMDGERDLEMRYRHLIWGEHVHFSSIKKYRTIQLFLVMRNLEFTIVGYSTHRSRYYQVNPVTKVLPDKTDLERFPFYFLDKRTLELTLLHLPASQSQQKTVSASWQPDPLFTLERYRLRI